MVGMSSSRVEHLQFFGTACLWMECSNLPKTMRIREDITNMSEVGRIPSAASIRAKLFADMLWYCVCYDYRYQFQWNNHHTGMQLLRVTAYTTHTSTAYTYACNWHTSVVANFKRQPEKKDALLMRRRGPCSEKARRGLQSWENPAQHKQKHGKEEREEEGKKRQKNMNHG